MSQGLAEGTNEATTQGTYKAASEKRLDAILSTLCSSALPIVDYRISQLMWNYKLEAL